MTATSQPNGTNGPMRARTFTDAGAVALAAGVAVGAARPVAIPVVVPLLVTVVGLVARRPWLVVIGAAVLAAALAGQALDGARPARPGPFRGIVTLASDPTAAFGAQQADVRAAGHRFELSARGSAASVLGSQLAGARVLVSGDVEPRGDDQPWLLRRHIVGQILAVQIDPIDGGDPLSQAANGVRRVLARGADVMEPQDQALFAGFVLGDDRGQSDETIADFRASGLTHLLVVSGENVAFVLILVRPLASRLGLRMRFVVIVTAVLFFALMTRFEPSVLRATAMALISTLGSTFGRSVSALRTLALAVAGLLLIDPFLVGSLGFQLSVAASLGIIAAARPLSSRLPGPRWLADTAGVTIAAQAGVAPVLLPIFSTIPVAALPANLLAVPAAGPVMVWGLTAGVAAGLLGSGAATVLHVPTRVLLWWLAHVAGWFAELPLGSLRWSHLLALAAVAGLVVVARTCRAGPRWAAGTARVGAVGVTAVLLAAALLPAPRDGPRLGLGAGAELWIGPRGSGTILILDGRARLVTILDGMRAAGVRHVDVVVARTVSRSGADTAAAVVDRFRPDLVLAPPGSTVPRAVVPESGTSLDLEGLNAVVVVTGSRLDVEVSVAAPGGVASSRARPIHVRTVATVRPVTSAGASAILQPRDRGPPIRDNPPGGRDGDPQSHAGLLLRPGRLLVLRRLSPQGRPTRGRRRGHPRRRWRQGGPRRFRERGRRARPGRARRGGAP
jgi:competence protein ComEC